MGTLELRNVTKRYGAVVAVDDANFKADNGEFLALLGPSGCGKSSTMRMIAGLETISEGDILIDGQRVNQRKPRERNVALAFESYALYTPLTVYENLAFPLRNGKFPEVEIDKRVRDIAEQFELTDMLKRKPGHLSGGQSQRVSLARALIRKPNVLLLDEPLSHLDHRLRVVLRARIRHIHDTAGGTPTVYVTHDQEEAVALADRIIVMNHAVIQQIGTFEDLLERPANQFVAGFVGDPSMNMLPATVEGEGSVRIDGVVVEIPAPKRPKAWPKNGKVVLGVRPERFAVAERGPDAIAAEVVVDEFQGDRSIITATVDGMHVKCVTPSVTGFRPGDDVGFRIDTNHVNFFDPETQLALARGGGSDLPA